MPKPKREGFFAMDYDDSQPAASTSACGGDALEIDSRLLRAERMECLAALTSGLTHALSNLLASTQMSIDVVLRTTPEGTAKQLLLTLRTMNRDGLEMVRQLLGIARGVAGEPTLYQPQYLLVEVQRLLTAYMPSLPVITGYPQDLWPLEGDPQTFVSLVLALCLQNARGLAAGSSLHLRAANVMPGATALEEAASSSAAAPRETSAPPATMASMALPQPSIVIEVRVESGDPRTAAAEADRSRRAARRPPASSPPAALWIVQRPPHPISALAAAAGGTYEAPAAGVPVARVYLPAAVMKERSSAAAAEAPLGVGGLVLIFEDEPLLAHALSEVLAARGYRADVAKSRASASAATPARAFVSPGGQADVILAAASLDAHGRWRLSCGAPRATIPVVLMIDAETADFLDRQPADHPRGFEPRAVLRKPFTTDELLFALAGIER
jgi:CheY-like chemotaxis protein